MARPERKMAVCTGSAPLSPEDRAELLAVLAADQDRSVAERASAALMTQPLESFLAALERPDAAAEIFTYCAGSLGEKRGIADAMARNAACPPAVLVRMARNLSAAGVQALLEDLDRLSSNPALVAAAAGAGGATVEQHHLLHELQEGVSEAPELEAAVKEAEPDPARRMTLLQRLSRMTVVERVQLALKGAGEERMALIRDPNKVIQRAVLQSPRLTEREVEGFAAMTSLPEEVLRVIALNRNYLKNYVVVRNLLGNSKTPLDISLHLLPRLTPRDLKLLTTNKNIPDTLRTTAMKLLRQRSETR